MGYVSILAANILSGMGSVMLILGSVLRGRRRLFFFQGAECFFIAFSQVLLREHAAALMMLIGVFRNLFFLLGWMNRWIFSIFLALTLYGFFYIEMSGGGFHVMSFLLLLSTLIWTVGSYTATNERTLRVCLACNLLAWATHALFAMDFVGALTNTVAFIFTARLIARCSHKKQKQGHA